MKAQRHGTNLKIQIRITLSVLGKPVDAYPLSRMTIAELETLNKELLSRYKMEKES